MTSSAATARAVVKGEDNDFLSPIIMISGSAKSPMDGTLSNCSLLLALAAYDDKHATQAQTNVRIEKQ
jgi:hypothetical protein